MRFVSSAASSNCMPRRNTAMASAETCSAGMLPSARPATKNAISPALSVPPSRFFRMTLVISIAMAP